MNFLFWRTCNLCKGIFKKKDMIHNVNIGMHYPWSFCKQCHEKFMK